MSRTQRARTRLVVGLLAIVASYGAIASPDPATAEPPPESYSVEGTPQDCQPISDSFTAAPVIGETRSLDQVDCFRLPTPSGVSIKLVQPGNESYVSTQAEVVDANGTQMACLNIIDPQYPACPLQGAAPFDVLIHRRELGSYAFAAGRTAGAGAGDECKALPVSAFGKPATTREVDLAAPSFVDCLTMAPTEGASHYLQFEQKDVEAGNADLRAYPMVADAQWPCGESGDGGWATKGTYVCTDAEAGYVVVLSGPGGVFRVAQHVLSVDSEGCQEQALGPVGTANAEGKAFDYLNPLCFRVATASDVRAWFDVHGPSGSRYNITAVNADDNVVCSQRLFVCATQGSSRYAYVLLARDEATSDYRLGAWNLGTKARPSTSCPRVHPDDSGFRLVAELTPARTAACIRLPNTAGDEYQVLVSGTGLGTYRTVPWLARPDPADPSRNATLPCTGYSGSYRCTDMTRFPEPDAVIVFRQVGTPHPEHVAVTGACLTRHCGLPMSIDSVSPSSTPRAESVVLALEGYALDLELRGWVSNEAGVIRQGFVDGSRDGLTGRAVFHNLRVGHYDLHLVNSLGFRVIRPDALEITPALH